MDFADSADVAGIELLLVAHLVLKDTKSLQHSQLIIQVSLLVKCLDTVRFFTLGIDAAEQASEAKEAFGV